MTEYTYGDALEELGLLKMDFLGLRTLTVIKDAAEGNCKLEDIDYEDKEVYEMISKGHTDGVFQLESEGMTNFMKELKPSCMEDIIAGISLYRPGPMDFIPKYLEGKRDTRAYRLRHGGTHTDPSEHLRLYRVPGAGYADSARLGRLQLRQK